MTHMLKRDHTELHALFTHNILTYVHTDEHKCIDSVHVNPHSVKLPIQNQEALATRYAGERISSLQLLAGLLIRSESIVAVARGGAEFGPRALGHRSFLAAAHRGELKERLQLG